jgi:hypothetical protein
MQVQVFNIVGLESPIPFLLPEVRKIQHLHEAQGYNQ